MKFISKLNHDLTWIILISTIGIVVHLLTYNSLGFHRDELLYLALGRHLATGYWSNPPLIGVIGYLSQLLPGDVLFNTRLIPALAGALLVFITGLTAKELGGTRFAQVLACVVISISLLILRGYSMLQPVPFDILIWTLILYSLLRYVNTGKPVYIILIGIGFGIGMMNKYMVTFLAIGLGLGALITPYRRLWWNRYTGIALLIAFVIFLPNLIWQLNHGFPVMKHMQELAETQLVNVKRTNILLDQVLMFTIGSVVWIAGLIWLLFSSHSRNYRLFAYTYLAILFMFLILHGKSYYMAGLYPFMFAAGGVCWEKTLRPLWLKISFAVLLLLLSLPLVPGGIPIMPAKRLAEYYSHMQPRQGADALLRWEDGKVHSLPQDFADMLGWNELGRIVVNACDSISDKNRIIIYGENYGQAGAVDYCGTCHRLPPAVSFSDSYLLWAPDSIDDAKNMFFYINNQIGDDVKDLFFRIDSIGSITNPYAREFGTTVYLCRFPRKDFQSFWAQRVKEAKQVAFGH
jgi:hypothetical protein